MNQEISDALFVISELLEDPTIPKNVKNSLNEIKSKLENNPMMWLS
jgi:uncharacterized protein (UPF0147 family)